MKLTERKTRDVEFKGRRFQFIFLEDRRLNVANPRFIVDIYGEWPAAAMRQTKLDTLHILPLSPLSLKSKEGFVYLGQFQRYQAEPVYGKTAEEVYLQAMEGLGEAMKYWRSAAIHVAQRVE